MSKNNKIPRYEVIVTPTPRPIGAPDPVHDLRAWLKTGLRRFGLRAVSVREVPVRLPKKTVDLWPSHHEDEST